MFSLWGPCDFRFEIHFQMAGRTMGGRTSGILGFCDGGTLLWVAFDVGRWQCHQFQFQQNISIKSKWQVEYNWLWFKKKKLLQPWMNSEKMNAFRNELQNWKINKMEICGLTHLDNLRRRLHFHGVHNLRHLGWFSFYFIFFFSIIFNVCVFFFL